MRKYKEYFFFQALLIFLIEETLHIFLLRLWIRSSCPLFIFLLLRHQTYWNFTFFGGFF